MVLSSSQDFNLHYNVIAIHSVVSSESKFEFNVQNLSSMIKKKIDDSPFPGKGIVFIENYF